MTRKKKRNHLINGAPVHSSRLTKGFVDSTKISQFVCFRYLLRFSKVQGIETTASTWLASPYLKQTGSSHLRRINMERHTITPAANSRHLKNMAIVFRTTFRVSSFKEGSIKTLAPAAGVNGTPTKSFG